MLTGKQLILATKPYAKEIRWKSWFHTISSLLLLIGALVGSFAFPHILGRIACSIFSAMMLARFFIIFHDYQHHTILSKSPLANAIFTVFGFYMLSPPSIWKRSHDFHHNHNAKLYSASIGSYPIMTKQKFLEATDKERFYYLSVRSPINMLLGYFTTFMYGMCMRSFINNPRKHWDSLVVLLFHYSFAAFLFIKFGWVTWFLTFFLPFFLSHSLGSYLFYAQHNFPEVIFRNQEDWTYADAALLSSSYMKMNPFMQWVTANIGFHHIHHLNARIPFYRLPEAMKNIKELQNPFVTTLKFSDIRKCLRLKVWDPEKNKMIGFSEMNS
jgi:acyl-lipid omega-6 desaturase (Delta-12 desaturase)